MAYAAVISLSNTIHRILNHNHVSISLEEKQQLVSLLDYVTPFQHFLDEFPDKFQSLEGRMREVAYEAEDLIEYFISEQVSSCSKIQTEEVILWLKQAINNTDRRGVKRGADSSTLSSSSTAPPIHKDLVVGFEDYVMEIKGHLCGKPSELQVIPICGMAGTGKTTLARKVYADPLVVDHFPISVWVTIPQDCSARRILSSLLQSLKEFDTYRSEPSYEEKVYNILRGRRYLVVMDNIWGSEEWDVVRKAFPDDGNGSRVILTTRLSYMASCLDNSSKLYQMGLLNADQSWNLFKRKVFGDENCPSKLENIGKEIARCCKGWPLALVAIARILSTTTRNLASWQEIRRDILIDLDFEKVLSSSDKESGRHPSGKQELKLKQVFKEIALIAVDVKEIKNSSSSEEVERGGADSSALSSSSTAPPIHKDSMVGFKDYVLELKDRLCGEPSKKLQVIPICGMGGIGKTTLARNVYDDPVIMSYFDIRVWVTISQDYTARRILSNLLESLKEFDTGGLGETDDEKIHKILIGRRYLVVMDDIWSSKAWDVVRRVFPDYGSGSRVIITTRLYDVASYPDPSSKLHEIGLLSTDQSWNLLKQKVFADEECPELENIGKEIARSCKGLPLAIVVIAGLLSTATKNPTSWLEIAENVKSAQTTEHVQIEEILSLSYVQLPQYLRSCFLYMASFPEDKEILVKKLIRLWVAEGFVESPVDSDCFEKVGEECLEELVKRNLVMVRKRKWDGRIKSCSLHDMMRDLCIRKAHESKLFLNVMDTHLEKARLMESIKHQRHVSINCTYLNALSRNDGSTIRSFRCSNYHLLKLEFVKSVKLLRVLDTEIGYVEGRSSVHQLCELSHLRYLAFRYTSSIPRGLSLLQNLQTLIVHGEKFRFGAGHDLWLSWCMPQLRHVYFNGTIYFEDPKETTCSFKSLQTVSYVRHLSCTERILKRIPNLKKLKIGCSDTRYRQDTVWLTDLVHLHKLEILEIYDGRQIRHLSKQYKITYPSLLKRLTLCGLSLSWSNMIVGSLPNLQLLKLKDCTCVGGTWETMEGAFPMLEVLMIIRLQEFKTWITESSHFPRLRQLLVNSCRGLNEIPSDIGEIATLELIEVTGKVIKESLMESLELIQQEQEELGNDSLRVLCIAK